MKTYQVVVPKPVQKQLNGLPYQLRDRILKRLIALEEDARPHGFVKLKVMKMNLGFAQVIIECDMKSLRRILLF